MGRSYSFAPLLPANSLWNPEHDALKPCHSGHPMVNLSPLEWASQHLQLIGWPALLVIAWRVRGYFETVSKRWEKVEDKTTDSLLRLSEVKHAVDRNEASLNTISGNHLAHIETGIVELNNRQDRSLEVLNSIDKGISVLVDRTRREGD